MSNEIDECARCGDTLDGGSHGPYGHPFEPVAVKTGAFAPSRIAVVESPVMLRAIARWLEQAANNGRKVRFTVDGGLKVDSGWGWTPPEGRLADETGN